MVVVVRRIARALLAGFTNIIPFSPDKQLAELSKARLRTGIRGCFPGLWVAIEASMSMLLLGFFDRPRVCKAGPWYFRAVPG
jgi:hypothetical protein